MGKKKPKLRQDLQVALASLEGEGRRDSSGQFTLSGEEATRKLGAFQLPTPQSWLLVLVQAANRGDARGVKVSQSALETEVEIGGLPDWDWPDLEPYLAEPIGDGSFLSSLATALRALAVAREYHEFSVGMPNGMLLSWGEAGWATEPGGTLARLARAKTTLRYSHLGKSDLKLDYFSRRRSGRRVMVDLNLALAADAFVSSVPIRCDGRVISGVHLGDPSKGKLRRPVAFLPFDLPQVRPVAFPTPSRWTPLREWERELKVRFRMPAAGATPAGKGAASAGLALVFVALKWIGAGKHANLDLDEVQWSISWVHGGVVVQRQGLKMHGSLGLEIFASAEGLPTDLSGLSLQQGPPLKARVRKMGDEVAKAVAELVDSDEGVTVDSSWSPLWTAVLGGTAIGAGLVTGGTGLFTGAFFGGVACFSVYSQKERLDRFERVLDTEMKTLPRRVTRAFG